VLRLFEITRLDTTFEIVDSRDAAVAAVRRAGEGQDGRDVLGSSDSAP
jgi:hypothetical protein